MPRYCRNGRGAPRTRPPTPNASTAAINARRNRLFLGRRTRPGVSLSLKLMKRRLPETVPRPGGRPSDIAPRRQRDEGSAIALTQHSHQRCKVCGRQQLAAGHVVIHGKRDRMDAHASAVGIVRAVLAVDLPHDRVDRTLREVVAVNIERHALLGVVVRIDRLEDALARGRVRERVPVAQPVDDRLPGAGRVRDPLVAVALEEILALVVEDLDTLHRRVHLERLADLALHHVPRVLTHAARGVDDENDVFAIDWNAADLVFVYRRAVIRKEALHLLAELLLRLS